MPTLLQISMLETWRRSRMAKVFRRNGATSFLSAILQSKRMQLTHNVTLSTRIVDLLKFKPVGSRATLKGWVKGLRKMKDYIFVDLCDGSGAEAIQIFIPKSASPSNLRFGSAIEATGNIQLSSNGQLELTAERINVVGDCSVTDGYPFTPKQTYPSDYTRQFLHFRPRSTSFGSLLRVRDVASQAFHKHFRDQGFVCVHTPVITSNDCEGAGEVFSIKPESKSVVQSMKKDGISEEEAYFDTKAYLTVSGQMHLEAVVRALSKVYTFGPTFRAENSKTRLHLSEFYMLEAEVAFVDSLDDILAIMENMIKSVTQSILNHCEEDVSRLHLSNNVKVPLSQVVSKPFGVMSYTNAIDILKKNSESFSTQVRHGQGLGKEHELFLVKFNEGIPIFIVEWPTDIKPFYMKQSKNETSKVSLNIDVVGCKEHAISYFLEVHKSVVLSCASAPDQK